MIGKKNDKAVTLIAAHTEVVGDVKFSGQLFVSGKVNGSIIADKSGEAQATVVVAEDGCVQGEVRVPHVVINGLVQGNVYASDRVELAPQARVEGNVNYNMIEMQ